MKYLLLFVWAVSLNQSTFAADAVQPKALPPAPDGVVIQANLSYLPATRAEKLDLYLPAHREKSVKSPAVVIIHGGGWSGGDKSAAREFNIGTTLAKAGYVCVSVEYLKENGKRWPTNLLDCKNAVRYLRTKAAEYQIDPDHIGVIGGSAGGHLALMVSYTTNVKELESDALYPGISDAVQACVDLYGPANLLTRKTIAKDGTPGQIIPAKSNLVYGPGGPPEDEKLWILASPVNHVHPTAPPTLILHGTIDTTVDRDQSIELDKKLTAFGVEHQLILLEGTGHTFDLQTWNKKRLPKDLRPIVTEFFDKHLKPKK